VTYIYGFTNNNSFLPYNKIINETHSLSRYSTLATMLTDESLFNSHVEKKVLHLPSRAHRLWGQNQSAI